MSDNDLIRRSDVRSIFEGHYLSRNLAEYEWQFYKKQIDIIPAVPKEMSAREYLYHRNRICHARYVARQDDDEFLCEKCVLKEACAPSNEAAEISKSIAIVEKWAAEHPEERSEQ